jgi:uncharacterized protein YuzE
MKLQIDNDADALYLHLLDSPVADSRETAPGVVLDYNTHGELVGVEMLYLSKRNKKTSGSMVEFESLTAKPLAVHESDPSYGGTGKG